MQLNKLGESFDTVSTITTDKTEEQRDNTNEELSQDAGDIKTTGSYGRQVTIEVGEFKQTRSDTE